MRTILAAAVRVGDCVKIPPVILMNAKEADVNFGAAVALRDVAEPYMTIAHVENASPRAGIILWRDTGNLEIEIAANQRVEVVSLG